MKITTCLLSHLGTSSLKYIYIYIYIYMDILHALVRLPMASFACRTNNFYLIQEIEIIMKPK